MTREITFPSVIVLLVGNSKTVLSLLQVSFSGRKESYFLLESPIESVCVHVWCIFLLEDFYNYQGVIKIQT